VSSRILELEHATIRPLGEYPGHCERCRQIAETKALQENCGHESLLEEVEVTSFGSPGVVTITICSRCGKNMGGRQGW
jgi:hypothetical protein